MIEAQIDAPAKLDVVVRVLRDLEDKELNRELFRGLNRATTKPKAQAKEEAGRRLPKRGGLARRVATAKLSTSRRGGRNPGVSIRARGMEQLAGMDAGFVKHPVFGNKDVWVVQRITPGWFSEPMAEGGDEARQAIEDVLEEVARDVARKIDGGV